MEKGLDRSKVWGGITPDRHNSRTVYVRTETALEKKRELKRGRVSGGRGGGRGTRTVSVVATRCPGGKGARAATRREQILGRGVGRQFSVGLKAACAEKPTVYGVPSQPLHEKETDSQGGVEEGGGFPDYRKGRQRCSPADIALASERVTSLRS